MNYTNTPQLRGWLENGFSYLASMEVFQIEASDYMRHMSAVADRPAGERADAAAFRCLTFDKPIERQEPPKPQQILMQQDQILKAHASQVEQQRQLHAEHAKHLETVNYDVLAATERVLDRIETATADNVERFTGLHTHVDNAKAFVVREISDRSTDAADRARGIHAFQLEEHARSRRQAWIRAVITWGLLILLILLFAVKGHAQNVNPAIVVATCGTPPVPYPAAGQRAPNTVDVNGNQCAGVSVSATIATAGLAISVSTGASTSGVVVTPVAGMVSTGAPSYVTGTVRELSLDTAGALRVNAAVSVPGALSVSTTTGGNGGQVAVVGALSDGASVTFAPIYTAGLDDSGKLQAFRTTAAGNTVVSLETTSGSIGTVTVTDGAGALNTIVDSGTLTAVTSITNAVTVTDGAGALNVIVDSGAVTVSGTTGGVAVTIAGSSGGTITTLPLNQNGVKTGGQICNSAGDSCATITGGKLDVNATVSAAANQVVSTSSGGNSGQVAVVGARSSGTAVTFGPVFAGGKDDSGNLEAVRTTVAGNVVVSLETTSGVIGHIVADTGSTTAVTGNVTVVQPTGTNLHAVLDTTSTTAVTQATGTNLHAVLDNTAGAPVIASIQSNGVGVGIITATNAQKSDISSIAGVAASTGAGVSGTGTQRVSVANDSFTAGAPAIVSIQSNGTGVAVGAIAAVMSTSGALVTNSVEYGVAAVTATRTLTQGQVAPVTITSSGATAVTPTGYTTVVAWGSSVNLAVTNSALVTVGAGLRIVLYRANLTCASTVSVAVTVSLGFGASTLPASGAGLIWAGMVTAASQFQGLQDGSGWPNVLGLGADGEDLRLTITVPTGGSCQVSLTYSTETTS